MQVWIFVGRNYPYQTSDTDIYIILSHTLHLKFKGPLTTDAAESVGQHGDAAPAADLADPGDKCSLLLNMQALELRLGLREEILYH